MAWLRCGSNLINFLIIRSELIPSEDSLCPNKDFVSPNKDLAKS